MASSISLGIIIGASINSSVGSAFQSISRQAQQLTDRLGHVRLAREASQDVQRMTAELARLQAQNTATGGSDARLVAEIARVEQELQQATTIAQRYGIELTDLAGETARLQQAEARLTRELQRRQQLDTNRNRRQELMGETMGVVALGAAFAMPIKKAMEFEHKNSELSAVLNENTTALQEQARQLGRDTSFDAAGATDAQIALAKAGMNAQKVLGATPVVLGIAAASQMQLGETAELTAEIMGGYSIKMDKMGQVADVLVKTANLSTTSVRDIGESLKYVGGVASTVGISFEQTNGMLATLSNNSIKGGQAGTALRMGFLRLSQPTSKAQKALDSLGVSIQDAKGNFRDMPTILKELETAASKLGNADKLAAYGTIFGAESSTAFMQLGKSATSGELDKMIAQVQDSKGSAKDMADKMQNDTTGALERLGGSFSDLGITIGNALLPSIRKAAENVGGLTDNISALTQKYPAQTNAVVQATASLLVFKIASIGARFGMTLVSDAVTIGKGVMDFFRLSTMQANVAIVRQRVALTAIAIQSRIAATGTAIATAAQWLWNAAITANPLGLLVIGIAAVGVAIAKYWEPIKAFTAGMWDGLKIGLAPVLEALAPLQPVFDAIGSAISGIVGWIGQLFTPLSFTKDELAGASSAGQQFGMVLGSAITSLISVVGTLAHAVTAIGVCIGESIAIGVSKFEELRAAGMGLIPAFFSAGTQIMSGLLNGLSEGFARVKARIAEMANIISSTFKSVLGIHSPSRVFAEIGGNVNEGLTVGLESTRHKPIGETVRIADMMARGFQVDTSQITGRVNAGIQNGQNTLNGGALHITINVNQLAGENSEDLTNRIMAKIKQQQQLSRRGQLYD